MSNALKKQPRADVSYMVDFNAAEEHLDLIDGADVVYDFRAIGPKGSNLKPMKRRGALAECKSWIQKRTSEGYGIYFTVHETDGEGVTLPHITRTRAAFRENDDGYKDGGTAKLPIKPSFVIETSPGSVHEWFLTRYGSELSLEEYEGVMRCMVVYYGSDKGARDGARVLRLAGTWNFKREHGEPFRIRIAKVNYKKRNGEYVLDEDGGAVLQDYGRKTLLNYFPPMNEAVYNARMGIGSPKKGKAKKSVGRPGAQHIWVTDPDWDAEIVKSALEAIHPDDDWAGVGAYQSWVNIAWALANGNGGGEEGEQLFLEWSSRSADYDEEEEALAKYHDETQNGSVTLGTLFRRAMDSDWVHPRNMALVTLPMDDDVGEVVKPVEGVEWREVVKLRNPDRVVGDAGSFDNVELFLELSGVTPWQNDFDRQIYITNGNDRTAQITDELATDMRIQMHRAGCRIGKDFFLDSVSYVARKDRRHPVREYLRTLEWDAKPRLKSMLHTYAGCVDNEYVEAVGLRWMVAAVRRVFQPGYKFDAMLILEGKQEAGKSSFAKILAKDDWFGDATEVGASPKEIIETTEGNWIVECAELSGLKKSDVNAVKTFVTRTSDKARLAYGRFASEVQRQFVLMGTVNEDDYLYDDTGNRRFWPVKVALERPMDLDGLRRDADQLWAEAVTYALDSDFSTMLPKHLKGIAAAEQEKRRVIDPMEEELTDTLGPGAFDDEGPVYITNDDVFKSLAILEAKDRKGPVSRVVKSAMTRLGWQREKRRIEHGGKPTTIYIRGGDWDGEHEVERIRLHTVLDDRTREYERTLMLESDYVKLPRWH